MNPWNEIAIAMQSAGAGGTALLLILKVTLILLIARLLLLALPKASAAAKHLIVTLALCGAVVLPMLTVALPAWNFAVLAARPAEQPREIGISGDAEGDLGAVDTALTIARVTGVVAEERISAASRVLQIARDSWQGQILMVLALVSLALVGRMFAGMLGVFLVARRSEEITDDAMLLELDEAHDRLRLGREVRLLQSTRISVPVVWGIFRPILLLPAEASEWSRERLRVVLLHELAHLKRADSVTLLVTRLAAAVYWFHPLVWSLEAIGRAECERACDDLVLAGGTKASDYAEHLLQIARALPHADPFRSVTLAMSRRSQLEGRLLSILGAETPRRTFSSRAVAIATGVALMVIVPLSSLRLVAQPTESKTPPQIAQKTKEQAKPAETSVVVEADARETLLSVDELLETFKTQKPRTADGWYDLGAKMHNEGRYAEAAAAYKEAIALGKAPKVSYYNLACAYAMHGDVHHAVEALEDSLAAGWHDFEHIAEDSDFDGIRRDRRFQRVVDAYAQKAGVKHDHDKRYDDARSKFEILRREHSTDGGTWYDVGVDLLRLRELGPAIESFQHALRLKGQHANTLYNLACAYALQGDSTQAMQMLEKALHAGATDADHIRRDPDLASLRKHPRFQTMLTMAKDWSLDDHRSKKDWSAWTPAREREEWQQAAAHFRAMTAKYPNVGLVWFNYGYALLQTRDAHNAVLAFKRSADLNHRPGTSAYNVACAYAVDGNKDAAFDWLEQARAHGMKLHDYLDDDEDLDNLRNDPRFDALLLKVWKEKKAERAKAERARKSEK